MTAEPVHKAAAEFSGVLKLHDAGQAAIIVRAGKPVARIVRRQA